MKIAFIGGRGSGKTTIAQAVAEKLGRKLWVMDDLICYEADGLSIPEIVKKHSWLYFRDLEYKVIQKLSGFEDIVIDCGGGVVTDLDQKGKQIYSKRKVAALKKNSIVIWLVVPPDVACKRIGDDPNRPSLSGNKTALEEMAEIINLRTPWYKKAADYSFDTNKMSVGEIVFEIGKIINNN